MRMPRADLILLHPPSVFKFRELPLFYGPVSDVVPSSSIFEIYPIGFDDPHTCRHGRRSDHQPGARDAPDCHLIGAVHAG
jgi:hypothetical protein